MPNKKDPKLWSLRPHDDIKQLVEDALNATGQTKRQTLIFEVLEKYLPDYVRAKSAERHTAEARFKTRVTH